MVELPLPISTTRSGLRWRTKAVGHLGIDALKKTVVKVKIVSVMSGVFRKCGTFAGKREQVFFEPRDLFVKMKVKRSAGTAGAPILFTEGFEAGNGKVEMARNDANAQPVLHELEQVGERSPHGGSSHQARHDRHLKYRMTEQLENRASFDALPPADYGVRCRHIGKGLKVKSEANRRVWKGLRKLEM